MVTGKLLIAIISTLIAAFILFIIGFGIIMIRCKMLFGDFNPSKCKDAPRIDRDHMWLLDTW